jgi:hypothetical protein
MSAIEGNPRAIESCKDMVNRSVAGRVARSQRLSQSHVRVGVRRLVSVLSVAHKGAYQRSTSRFAYFLSDAAITWSLKKQPTIALSSSEAEYMAASHCSKEGIWLRSLLNEIGHGDPDATNIYCNNFSAITLTKDPTFHAQSKHIDICHHFVHERVESGELNVSYISTNENVADILTKGLPRPKHETFVYSLGLSAGLKGSVSSTILI